MNMNFEKEKERRKGKRFAHRNENHEIAFINWLQDKPRSAVRIWNEDADVNTKYWEDDAEERDRRELADEFHANEDTDEHEKQQNAAVDPVAVVRVGRDVDRTEQRQGWRRHVLLSQTTHSDSIPNAGFYPWFHTWG